MLPAGVYTPYNDNLTQSFNRYAYVFNNPLSYTDPSGHFPILGTILIGAAVNVIIQAVTDNIDNFGDFALAFAIGGASGAAGWGVSTAVSSALVSAGTSVSLGFLGGAVVGGAGGFAGGFVGSAGNAWASGASFSKGLGSGFRSGFVGGISGGIIGGIAGGIRYGKSATAFRRGNDQLGIQSGDPVPATDDFLNQAREAWYPDAPMDNLKDFTVENVPVKTLKNMQEAGAAGATTPYVKIVDGIKYYNGRSSIYFNSSLSHTSAKQLFFTMGHEFVHASQYAALSGVTYTPEFHKAITEVLEYHAYSYEYSVLGSSNYGGFTPTAVGQLMGQFPNYFQSLSYTNYPWTTTANFIYPFR